MQNKDAAAAISNAAISGKDKYCQQALDWFIHFYGVEAGNHALKIMSTGGVFLGGGIAPKIIKQLQNPEFRFVLIRPKDKAPFEMQWQKAGPGF